MKLLTLLLTFTLSFQSFACPNHLSLEKGEQAPCEGHFFNNDTEKRIRKDVRDNELRKQEIELKDLQVEQLKEDRERWKEEAEYQSKARHERDGDLTKGFMYGIGLTLAILFGAKQVIE